MITSKLSLEKPKIITFSVYRFTYINLFLHQLSNCSLLTKNNIKLLTCCLINLIQKHSSMYIQNIHDNTQ
jgi:hypothetical protein